MLFVFGLQTPLTKWKTEAPYPLVIRGSFRLILDLFVHWLPGHWQAIEMGHLQRAHLLHLWPSSFLHALVWQVGTDKNENGCVWDVRWGSKFPRGEGQRSLVACFLSECYLSGFPRYILSVRVKVSLFASFKLATETTSKSLYMPTHVILMRHRHVVLLRKKQVPTTRYYGKLYISFMEVGSLRYLSAATQRHEAGL